VRSHFSRVKVGRGPVIVPESVAARGYWKPRRGDRPFPNPAHRTVHAVFPHTALGRVSHRGMRKRPQMKAPKLEHPQLPEHPRAAGKRCVPREGTGCLLGLGVQYLLESLELRWSYQAHANLPPLASVRHAPNQGPFPPPWLCCPGGPRGTVDPSDSQAGSRPEDGARAATPRRPGSPVLRWALCRRATPPTPASDPVLLGRFLGRRPAAFPVIRAGRRSHLHFRGLRGLHTCCGPSACRSAHGGPMSRGLRRVGYPSRRLGSYWGVPTTPQAGLAPARTQRLSRRAE
jgi:hypothetical protein